MISRKSTSLIGQICGLLAVGNADSQFYQTFDIQLVHRFFYDQEYDDWFLRQTKYIETWEQLAEFICGLHTGERVPAQNKQAERFQLGQATLKKLAVDLLDTLLAILKSNPADPLGASAPVSQLLNQLELDGYVYKTGRLLLIEGSVIDEQQEQDYLTDLIDNAGLPDPDTIKHHLRLSEEHYVDKKWDDSISNARKVLDAILNQLATNVYLAVNGKPIPLQMLKHATDIRLFLERQGLITTQERELIEKLYGLLSSTGGHPYIAEQDQARLMRQQVLTNCQFILLQYRGLKDGKSLASPA